MSKVQEKPWRPGENAMLYVGGNKLSYHCETPMGRREICGCNVFSKRDEPNTYECNSCGVIIREGAKP